MGGGGGVGWAGVRHCWLRHQTRKTKTSAHLTDSTHNMTLKTRQGMRHGQNKNDNSRNKKQRNNKIGPPLDPHPTSGNWSIYLTSGLQPIESPTLFRTQNLTVWSLLPDASTCPTGCQPRSQTAVPSWAYSIWAYGFSDLRKGGTVIVRAVEGGIEVAPGSAWQVDGDNFVTK